MLEEVLAALHAERRRARSGAHARAIGTLEAEVRDRRGALAEAGRGAQPPVAGVTLAYAACSLRAQTIVRLITISSCVGERREIFRRWTRDGLRVPRRREAR